MYNNDKIKLKFIEIVSKALQALDDEYKKYLMPMSIQRMFYEVNINTWKYYGHYWFCLNLDLDKKRTDDYDGVTAIIIKPYRIDKSDVERAVNGRNRKAPKLEDAKSETVYYDNITGNYHKQIKSIDTIEKIDFQIILANKDNRKKQYGPGWKKLWSRGAQPTEENIKTEWYFPRLDEKTSDKTDKVKELKALILRAIKEIYNSPESEQK